MILVATKVEVTMLVSMRSWFLLVTLASACADSGAMSGAVTGDDDGSDDVTALQCSSTLACPAPTSSSKQTICGQIYDFETNVKLAEAVPHACTVATESGPCSLAIGVYDAIAFGQNPTTAAQLPHGTAEIDGCGRYRVTDIDVNGIGPFVALVIDDPAHRGSAGTTVPTAIATFKIAGAATDQVEAWIVRESTTTQWSASGGPPLSGGLFVPVFRAHMVGTAQTDPLEPQAGVTVTKNGNSINGDYFDAAVMDRLNVDTEAVMTGINGTALITQASVADAVAYSGVGGLVDPTSCRWEHKVGMSLAGIVFIQIFRPLSQVGLQCPL
jgi:hypothetical protein